MKKTQSVWSFGLVWPVGWATFAGLTLAASGQIQLLISTLLVYLLIRYIRPEIPGILILCISEVISDCGLGFASIIGKSWFSSGFLELCSVVIVSLFLLVTQNRLLAISLVIYLTWMVSLNLANLNRVEVQYQQYLLGYIFVKSSVIILLLTFVFRKIYFKNYSRRDAS